MRVSGRFRDIEHYQGGLSLSPSGNKIGYFEDGDTIDVLDTRIRAGRSACGRDSGVSAGAATSARCC